MSRHPSYGTVDVVPLPARPGLQVGGGHRPVLLARFDPTRDLSASTLLATDPGIDGIDVDIQMCKTGEPVVFSRDRIGIFDGHAGYVSEGSLDSGKALAAKTGERVLALSELLSLIAAPHSPVLSVRLLRRGTAIPVLQVLERAAARGRLRWDRVLVCSPILNELAQLKYLSPGVTTAFVTETAEANYDMVHTQFQPDCFFIAHEHADLIRVSFLHDLGARVFVWKVSTETEIDRAVSLGVDGIVTDSHVTWRPKAEGRPEASTW